MFSPLVIDISPNLIKDLQLIAEQVENYYITSEAKIFRPMESPLGHA